MDLCYFKTYAGKVPGGADLVCYWFEKARAQIKANKLQAAGLVSTQAIRKGSNRTVLDKIVADKLRIFLAWSDEPWINDGAAVNAVGRQAQRHALAGPGPGQRQAGGSASGGQPLEKFSAL